MDKHTATELAFKNGYQKAAEDIFEEIEEFMIDSTLYKMPSKVMLSSKFADLKKKYLPQCPTCKHFVGCECFDGKTCDQYKEVENG